MAKALYGNLTGRDPLLVNEVMRLRSRIAELESEVARLQRHVDDLELVGADLAADVYLDRQEPAFA